MTEQSDKNEKTEQVEPTQQSMSQEMSAEARLLALAISLADASSSQRLFELVANHVRLHLGVDRASICLVDPEDPTIIEAMALAGSDISIAGGTRMPVDQTMVGTVAVSGVPRFWTLAGRDELDAQSLVERGVVAAFVAPISSGPKTFGTFNVGYLKHPEGNNTGANSPEIDDTEVTSSDQDLLVRLATLLGSQLARIEAQLGLKNEIETRELHTLKLEQLHSLESQLASASNLDEVINSLSIALNELIDVKRVSFIKLGPTVNEAQIHGIFGIQGTPGFAAGTTLEIDRAALITRFSDSKDTYIPDHRGTADPIFRALASAGVMSSMNLGIFVNGDVSGMLNVGASRVDGISATDQSFIRAVASFMGSALQRIEAQDELLFLANHDHLTGLIRRRLFNEQVDQALQAATAADRSEAAKPDLLTQKIDALCFIDIDHFKLVNDTDGHLAGDDLLRDISSRISRSLGDGDIPSRLGPDFIILLKNRTRKEHEKLARSLTKAVSSIPFISDGRAFQATVSIGLAAIRANTISGAQVLASAEAASHESKRLGGNRVSVESLDGTSQAVRRSAASWMTRVQQAIDNDEFVLYAQPIRPISKQGVTSAEVLVRLLAEDGSVVSPDRFVPIAEQYGLICRLDSWVTEHALAAMKAAIADPDADAPELIFINLSPNSISADGFFDRLRTIVARSGVPTERIVFEITETGSMYNFETTLEFVNRMRAFGPRFALDDFGVGLSSLGYLRQLDIDFLKIDGSLVREVGTDPIKTTMVSAIKAMADALEVRTIAEHIDDGVELATLKDIGIDHVQGYFVGHPAPIERALGIAPTDRVPPNDRTTPTGQVPPAASVQRAMPAMPATS